jgi:hypothetical protein
MIKFFFSGREQIEPALQFMCFSFNFLANRRIGVVCLGKLIQKISKQKAKSGEGSERKCFSWYWILVKGERAAKLWALHISESSTRRRRRIIWINKTFALLTL